jgi:hypothetical protein
MKREINLPRFGYALVALTTYSTIFAYGLQYSFYKIFSKVVPWDDEGTMMLRVQALIEDPASYDSLSGVYGPFYYLHKYAIYGLSQADVSHDFTRLTTIILWGLIAAACAFFVHRVSRSIVLAAVVQMQLILHLTALQNEPGHPHEIALVLIAGALVVSSFVDTRRAGLVSMMGLGALTGALLLVKVNLGVYVGAAFALAMLLFLPRNTSVRVLGWLTAAVSLFLPAAIMWRHLDTPWGRDYCVLVTLLIAASLVTAAHRSTGGALRWRHVNVFLGAAAITIASVFAVVIGWGNPLSAIANSVILRALSHPSNLVVAAPISDTVVMASALSIFLASCYALAVRKIRVREAHVVGMAIVKLAYFFFAFYYLTYSPSSLLRYAIAVPFIWLVLVEPDPREEKSTRELFARISLCLLAAFQTLQAYPVGGSQQYWAVFLVVPVAALCFGDGLRSLRNVAMYRWKRDRGWPGPTWLQPTFTVLLLFCIGTAYYAKADIVGLEAAYAKLIPLDTPGASRMRLKESEVRQLRWAVENLKSHCDGFVGMPGFASMYFWTKIAPPGTINNAWILNLEDDRQHEIIEVMQTYERSCVLRNPGHEKFWRMGRWSSSKGPLERYIQTQYKPFRQCEPYTLLVKKDRPIDVEAKEAADQECNPSP